MPLSRRDNGATRDGSTKETFELKIFLIFRGLKRLTKLVHDYDADDDAADDADDTDGF